jgi:hypothetical protein
MTAASNFLCSPAGRAAGRLRVPGYSWGVLAHGNGPLSSPGRNSFAPRGQRGRMLAVEVG